MDIAVIKRVDSLRERMTGRRDWGDIREECLPNIRLVASWDGVPIRLLLAKFALWCFEKSFEEEAVDETKKTQAT